MQKALVAPIGGNIKTTVHYLALEKPAALQRSKRTDYSSLLLYLLKVIS